MTVHLVIQETNKQYKEFAERRQKTIEQEHEKLRVHKRKVDDIANQIKFSDDDQDDA